MGMKNPGSGGGEIVQVQGGHIVRSVGRKDRHSKVFTAKGPRDRRVRLSAHTAIQFYDVQDRLGYDRPSKAVDWLIKKAKSAIDNLAELPPWNPTPDPDPVSVPVPHQPDDPPATYAHLAGLSFFPAATSDHPQPVSHGFHSYQPESHSADHLGLSLHPFHSGDSQAPSAPEQALFGFGPGANQYHRSMAAWNAQESPGGGGGGGFGAAAAAFNQRGTLQSSSSFSQLARAWDDLPSMAAASSARRPHHHQQIIAQHHHQTSSIFGTRFDSDGGGGGGGGFPVFCVPARIHGEDEEGHGGVSGRPSDSSSPNSAHRS